MFKTNNKISNEAEALYTEHKGIHEAIAKKTEYVDSAEQIMGSMIKSGAASDVYVDDMRFDIALVQNDISLLETESANNVLAADEHLRTNPRIFNIAVKNAMRDGVEIKT